MSNYSIPSYSPHDQSSNASESPWSASSHTGSGYESLTLAPINPEYDPFDFNDSDQYFDSLHHLQSSPYLHEPSNSRDQEQQPPPSNQQATQLHSSRTFSRYQVSESPDLFEDFIEQDFAWQDSPRPQQNARSQNTTRASSVVDLTGSSPPPATMTPNLRKRKAETSGVGRSVRQRPSTPPKSSRSTPGSKQKLEEAITVDLVGIEDEDQYEEFKAKEQAEAIKQRQQEEANKPAKLADFECIICMEKPTDMTVTHCGMSRSYFLDVMSTNYDLGHLFCSECLHQALYTGNAKKCCPVCRAVINCSQIGKGDQKKQPKNGIFAVEMKLMTANKKGKQPVRGR